jgi:hypothetical protein
MESFLRLSTFSWFIFDLWEQISSLSLSVNKTPYLRNINNKNIVSNL